MEYELKRLSKAGLERALAKAERYRLLNDPLEAESICRDVLETEPGNQKALVLFILSLTDLFGSRTGMRIDESTSMLSRLDSEYERVYYKGVIYERRAKVHFERAHPGAGHLAYDWYVRAMKCFEQADELSPDDNEDAKLRWNTCARTMMRHDSIEPGHEDDTPQMLE